MEIYLVFVGEAKTFLFASSDRKDAEKIRNYVNHNMVEKRDSCYTSIMANIESVPFGSFEDYLNEENILRDIIFDRGKELESLKRKLKRIQK